MIGEAASGAAQVRVRCFAAVQRGALKLGRARGWSGVIARD